MMVVVDLVTDREAARERNHGDKGSGGVTANYGYNTPFGICFQLARDLTMAALSTTTDSPQEVEASSSKVPLYEASTQFRNWRFSFDSLAQLRASMNEVAVDAVRRKIEADEVRLLHFGENSGL